MKTVLILLALVALNWSLSLACDPCQLPSDPGSCRGFFPRFFYNSQTAQCEEFIYGGCEGNANNYETLAECQAACGVVDPCAISFCSYPDTECVVIDGAATCKCPEVCKLEYQPVCGTDGNTYSNNCQLNVEACKPENRETLRLDHDGPCADPCSLTSDPGPCFGSLEHYFYNTETRNCEPFPYGGCQGNANNFEDLNTCQQICDPCSLPADPGPCFGSLEHYFYNTQTRHCEPFIYGGCQGNTNNFEALTTCHQTCDPCFQPKDPGPCFGSFERYSYNIETNQCEEFIYGGCQGNGNNFNTLERCHQACVVC
ncbi:tissue factor pathway inhibitor [Exaiptasia diaphana]|uniref:Uncharacterized protein n=1 Tax=Exaiptasia diaphana TaxID=2652724 RepID=A0A913YKY3_EXADI|nr:tissue factor pathway inhibitor [Exaiptasia diaphana]